ncbi:MAG TPA: hypothetical protein VFH51_08730, partial [Myxococcota bacterium]|nr:hypothetical protein [Myxococcota bacterium]
MLDLKKGDQAQARQRVEALKAAHPNDPATLTLEGDVLMATRDYAKAIVAYENAAQLKPSNALALRVYRARQAASVEHPEQPLEKWLARHPDDQVVRLVLAEAYDASGDRARAIAQYELMQRNGQQNAIVFNNLAWLYHQQGDSRAEETARQAVALAPRMPAVVDTYAWILAERGKAEQAVALYKGLDQPLDDPSAVYHYSVSMVRAGHKEEGRRKLVQLLEGSPNFREAEEARRLLASLGSG